jgi:predicted esterase
VRSFALMLLVACSRPKQQQPPPPAPSIASPATSPSPSALFVMKHGSPVPLNDAWLMNETEPMLTIDNEPRPVTFILHALCADQRWMCDWLQYGHLAPQWQLCPRGELTCGPGQYKWNGVAEDTRKMLELALDKAHERHGARVRDDATVLVGMSQGAYAVAALMKHKPSFPIRGIILHGAHVQLAANDVRGLRVVLCAGEQDGAAPHMKQLAESLSKQGITARYASFGKVGHFLPVDSAIVMAELIDWTRAL